MGGGWVGEGAGGGAGSLLGSASSYCHRLTSLRRTLQAFNLQGRRAGQWGRVGAGVVTRLQRLAEQ